MDHWLQCNISLGQFTGEYVVEAKDFRGKPFSLFVPSEYIDCSDDPLANQTTTGWLRVEQLAEDGGLVLVRLPRTPLENGTTVTVAQGQIVRRAEKELA